LGPVDGPYKALFTESEFLTTYLEAATHGGDIRDLDETLVQVEVVGLVVGQGVGFLPEQPNVLELDYDPDVSFELCLYAGSNPHGCESAPVPLHWRSTFEARPDLTEEIDLGSVLSLYCARGQECEKKPQSDPALTSHSEDLLNEEQSQYSTGQGNSHRKG
jgi:hypothetical protein